MAQHDGLRSCPTFRRFPPGYRIRPDQAGKLGKWDTVAGFLFRDWNAGRQSPTRYPEGSGGAAATGDATWLHTFYSTAFWTNPGGDFSPTASAATMVGGFGSYTWGSTPELVADVQEWLDNASINFGWLLAGNEAASPTAKRFDSRENLTESFRPKLTVDYTPGPLTISVLDIHTSGPDSVSLSWSKAGSRFAYTVEFSDSLAGGVWSPVPPVDQWPTKDTTWIDVSASGQPGRFYRVRGEQLP